MVRYDDLIRKIELEAAKERAGEQDHQTTQNRIMQLNAQYLRAVAREMPR